MRETADTETEKIETLRQEKIEIERESKETWRQEARETECRKTEIQVVGVTERNRKEKGENRKHT